MLAALAVFVYVTLSVWMFFYIHWLNGGHFVYSLDDPYIHLALGEQLAHGHYGINPSEFSSPSSSVVWPFLLAPFARLPWGRLAPLFLNLFAGIGVSIVIGAVVARWPLPEHGFSSSRQEMALRVIATVALGFTANLVGLAFTGMEHTLQVLLAGAGAWGILACLRGRPIPLWCLVAVALGPSVRYENLAISVALAIALAGRRQGGRAFALLGASMTPLLLFSLYLHHLGLPWLPTSVVVKSRVVAGNGVGQRGLMLVGDNLSYVLTEPQRFLLLLLFLTLVFVAWNEKIRERRFALAGAATAAFLHLALGRFNWLHRYEVYIVFFSTLVVMQVAHERARSLLGLHVLALVGCSFLYLEAFHDTPISASQIYRQQFQTHRFLTEFYTGDVAVNDLGLVSYRRRPGMYVLDLWGLASPEAASQKIKSTAWLDEIVRRHKVGLVVIYPLWFPPTPSDWTLLGELCIDEPPVVLGGSCVSYYATPSASLPELQDEFDDFVHTTPRGITVRTAMHLPTYR